MNEQKPPAAIEWTRVRNTDGTVRRGYTWNVVSGCSHDCRWELPDGKVAECYAKTVAEGVAREAYPHGFNHAYWHPERLNEPVKLKEPAGIFLDSMSDLMDTNVPDEHIRAVLDTTWHAPQHVFQLLTKNAPRLRKFEFPPNVWVGVSAPPTWYKGHRLSDDQQRRYVFKALDALQDVSAEVRWMSIEPLSFDIAAVMRSWGSFLPLEWAVIGAASNGRTLYQPAPEWVTSTLALLDANGIPAFMKGNLVWPQDWRDAFPPVSATVPQQSLF
jgi:protein gp37